jgi:hypothetical protein
LQNKSALCSNEKFFLVRNTQSDRDATGTAGIACLLYDDGDLVAFVAARRPA